MEESGFDFVKEKRYLSAIKSKIRQRSRWPTASNEISGRGNKYFHSPNVLRQAVMYTYPLSQWVQGWI
jgi:hypothetical protein